MIASASAKLATTWNCWRPWIEMSAELLPEEVDPVVDDVDDEVVLLLAVEEPPPPTT